MDDINQHFEQLRRILVKLNYPHSVDKDRICSGVTTELLPLLHYGLLSHSKTLAEFVCDSGYDLYQKNDLRFTEGIFKLLRKEFNHHPVLQCTQFLTDKGFAKRKIQFVVKALRLGIAKHNELIKKKRATTQSKVAWTETNLAKKMEKVIRKQPPSKTTNNTLSKSHSVKISKSKQSKQNKIAKYRVPPKGGKEKATIPSIQSQSNQIHQINVNVAGNIGIGHDQEDDDQVTNDVMEEEEEEEASFGIPNDSLSADEIRCNLPQPIALQHVHGSVDIYGTEESGDMEMESGGMDNDTVDIGGPNQSIQIPQHTFDVNLIPEYDPTVHGSSMSLQRVNASDAVPVDIDNDDHKDDDDDDEEEQQQQQLHQEAMDSVTGNKKHYSGDYLNTYSTLLDIPHSVLHQEMEEEVEARVTVISAVSQHKSTPALLGNIGSGRSEERDNKEEDSDHDRGHYGGRGDGDHSHSQSGSDDHGDDDDDDEEDEEKGKVPRNAMTEIVERLNAMEQRMDSQFQTINARLTILEGKVKFMESQRMTQSTTTTAQSEESKQQKVPSSVPPTEDNRTFGESTIGSSSLPISLTPGPIRVQNHGNNKLNATTFPIRSNLPLTTTRGNQPTAATMPRHRPKHIHAPTARSPFLSGTGVTGGMDRFQGYVSSINGRNESSASTTSGYRGNVMCDVMTYPLSSSSGNNERREIVPKIQSVDISSAGDRSAGRSAAEEDPESTLNFINDLKAMLKSTDKLLRAKPMHLYDP